MKFLLFPFSLLYQLITGIRNLLYDRGYKPQAGFDLPVISVGNLSMGGTGKTPMIEYLISLMSGKNRIATLSRGYKRKTSGFRLASDDDTAATLGDEPYQFFRKYGNQVIVAVGEERAMAIPAILHEHEVDVILLDDAFQHRRVKPSLSILLTDFNRPFFKDYVLPMGRLRESRSNVNRADLVVVTKCPPDLSESDQHAIEASVRAYTQQPVFFSTIEYGDPIPFGRSAKTARGSVILLTGIADPSSMVAHMKGKFNVLHHLDYPDHHHYTASDVENIRHRFLESPDAFILTTEKDMVKLKTPQFEDQLKDVTMFYLPIRPRFLKNGKDFDDRVLAHIDRFRDKNLP